MDEVSFGRWVQQRRQLLKLTQAELGALAGCSAAAVRKIEAEERRPSAEIAAGVARALCIAPDEQPHFLRFARGLSSQPPTGDTGTSTVLDSRVAGGLRFRATALIGRTREQADVATLLATPTVRIVTLTGPGGTGKTRLALAIASRLQSAYPDGVIVVTLAPIQDPAQVMTTIAGAMHISAPMREQVQEHLAAVLGDKRMLLVLDNFEQVLAAAAEVAELVRQAPTVQVLVTSRERLRIAGEQVYVVQPLPVPDEDPAPTAAALTDNDAVALFLERAQAARRDFVWRDDVAPSVAAICRRLDGLPLAIELAAAYLALLSPEALAAGMERRLALLTDGPRDAPPRHQTLRATIDWSYQLLSADEQRWFARLSGLVNPWPLDAAAAVGAFDAAERSALLPVLRALVEKSLIRPVGTVDHRTYFAMLETIQEYGLECLGERGERAAVATRHATFFLQRTVTQAKERYSGIQTRWREQLAQEYHNVRMAFEWALTQGDLDLGLRAANALYAAGIWYSDVQVLLDNAVIRTQGQVPKLRATALGLAGRAAWVDGDFAGAVTLCQESLAISQAIEDTEGIANVLYDLGEIALHEGQYSQALDYYQRCRIVFRVLDPDDLVPCALGGLAKVQRSLGNYDDAIASYKKLCDWFRVLGNTFDLAAHLHALGDTLRLQGNDVQAMALYGESCAMFEQLGATQNMAWSLHAQGQVAQRRGDGATALRCYQTSLGLHQQLRNRSGVAADALAIAALLGECGHAEACVRLLAAVTAFKGVGRDRRSPGTDRTHTALLSTVAPQLEPLAFRGAWEAGSASTVEQAIDEAAACLGGTHRVAHWLSVD